ncbi:MAG TPA: diguanylate cyclase, partial [Steroidobacteraceae bacterium]
MKPAYSVPEGSLGTSMILTIASSYLIDGALLTGFAMTGTISQTVPLEYIAIGLLDSAILVLLRAWTIKHQRDHSDFALAQVIGSSSIQLAFAALVPQMAFYFFAVLFIVFGCASLGLSKRQSAIAWIGVAVAAAVVMSAMDARISIPQTTPMVRALVWLCFVATLGRCILLGVFGRALRLRLQEHRRQLRDSVHTLKERDKSLANVNLELKRQATHDALTGIANRVLFVEHLDHAIHGRRPFAVCVFDLDRFKVINDSLGHGAGDALLKHVSERLQSIVRSSDVVARAGGDEFLLLLRNIGSAEEVETLIARWMSALCAPYQLTGLELHVSPSIGIARFPTDGTGAEELLARADEAMYFAKRCGRKTFRFFDSRIMGFSRERLEIEAELRCALAQGQLALHYQPKIDIATGEMRSVEALIRWRHPKR